jgi:hypothetical protein
MRTDAVLRDYEAQFKKDYIGKIDIDIAREGMILNL